MNRKTSRTIIRLICFNALLVALTILFALLYRSFRQDWMLSVYVTMLTISYHFLMRLMVGQVVTMRYRNRQFRLDSIGFRIHPWEAKLYKILRVKKWKANMITAKPEQFDIRHISMETLLHNVAQAELVHRIIMVLSFVPLVLIIPYGVPLVFILTSVFACLIDLQFVMMQRYNRPRIIRLMERQNRVRE